jgi:hypothetical protein
MFFSFSIELRECHAKTGVHGTEHDGVGQHLDKVALARGERHEHPRGQKDKEEDGDDDIEIHGLYIPFKNISHTNITR